MKDLSTGLRGFSRAFGFALRNGMWWLFLVPVLLWLLFAGGIVWASTGVVDLVSGWLSTWDIAVPVDDRGGLVGLWDDVKSFFSSAREVIVLVVVKLALWFLFGLVGKYIVLILLSPLLAYASERTEEILTGRIYPFRAGQFLKDVGRGILMALRNGGLELLINVLLWSITLFVAILAPVTVVLLWLVSSWFYGFSMFDYVYERHRLGIRASARAAWERPGMVLANGMLFNLLMNPPFLHWILGPLLSVFCFSVIPVAASIGAVLAWDEAEIRGPR
ncbi:MAG: EI24 domain-containing protein [Flavobacteriales bacterium]|nr:EI24 domain-containing protein [Flavobacteriales bacterium]